MPDIQPGLYRHYKGKTCRVLGIGKLEATLEDVVIYEEVDDQSFARYWVRTLPEFTGKVDVDGVTRPRFEFIGEK